jgi:hypothetical protein
MPLFPAVSLRVRSLSLTTFRLAGLVPHELLKYAKFTSSTVLNFPAFNIFQTLAPSRSFRKTGPLYFQQVADSFVPLLRTFFQLDRLFSTFYELFGQKHRGRGLVLARRKVTALAVRGFVGRGFSRDIDEQAQPSFSP